MSESLAVLTAFLSEGDPPRFDGSAADWRAVFALAGRHGLEGVLLGRLFAAGVALEPRVRQEVLEQLALERLAQAPLREALDLALAALEGAGVRAVSLKGPVLAERLYPDPSLRSATDLDFLVAAEDLARATRALEALGYCSEEGPALRYHLAHHYHVTLAKPGGARPSAPAVELHFRLYAGFGAVLPSEPFLARAVPFARARGPRTWVLAPEDELVFLAVHAAGHGFARLGWLYDVRLLVDRTPALDGALALGRASALAVRSAFVFACEELRRTFGVTVPSVTRRAREGPARFRAAERLLALSAGRPRKATLRRFAEFGYEALLADRTSAGVRHLLHHLWRVTRRRVQRRLPRLAPGEWAG